MTVHGDQKEFSTRQRVIITQCSCTTTTTEKKFFLDKEKLEKHKKKNGQTLHKNKTMDSSIQQTTKERTSR